MVKRLTTDDFVRKARAVHGDRYDYSKVDYKNNRERVCIVCPVHGEFWQRASDHLSGGVCQGCVNDRKMTTEKFIEEARKVHDDKYDYSKTEYVDSNTKVCVTCQKHGDFWVIPGNHLKGVNCQKCYHEKQSQQKRWTTEDFITRAKEVHGDKYDYSKTRYVDMRTKVCVICKEHGEFYVYPQNHIRGCECPRCVGNGKKSVDDFIEDARKVHGNKYDYSKVEYKDSHTKVCIICPIHGEFLQTPSNHLKGRGCKKCATDAARERYADTKEEFIEKSRLVHGDKYDYSKVEYVNGRTKVCIICNEIDKYTGKVHGEFWQTPADHLHGYGCPHCAPNEKMDTERFIIKAKCIHGDKYDYSKTEYTNNRVPVIIKCGLHGDFEQLPTVHLRGGGCPVCGNSSHLESEARKKTKTRLQKHNFYRKSKISMVKEN